SRYCSDASQDLLREVDVMRVQNGKITDHWGVGNLLSLMQQIGGWIPPAGEPQKKRRKETGVARRNKVLFPLCLVSVTRVRPPAVRSRAISLSCDGTGNLRSISARTGTLLELIASLGFSRL